MDSAANEMNLGALLPSIGFVVVMLRLLAGALVLAGPLAMLGFGLLYTYKPPKEANYSLGYRCWWGMASLDSWTYTQKIAGEIFTVLGAALSAVMLIVGIVLLFLDMMAVMITAVICLGVELLVLAGACIVINVLVIRKFDRDGYARGATE